MSEKVRRVDYSADEYISGVGGVLTAEQQGVYWMICSLIISEGCAIEFNERRIAAQCLVRPSRARALVESLIAMGKIKVDGDGKLYQNRALNEVERAAKRIKTASENGTKGGRPAQIPEQKQQDDKATGSSGAKLTTNDQPPTIIPEEKKDIRTKSPRKRLAYTELFLEFWKAFPTDSLMSKSEAFKAFDALPEDEQHEVLQSVPAFRAYCSQHVDYRPVHACRYITQRRFEGFVKTQAAVDSREFVAMGSAGWTAIMRLRGVNTMPHSDRNGVRGWFFDRDEVKRALAQPEALNWQTQGAA
jgi:hypothetical protein